MSATRLVRVRPGLRRNHAEDHATQLRAPRAPTGGPPDGGAIFDRYYEDVIRPAWRRSSKQGVLILAFDGTREPVGEVWVRASLDQTRAAIIGRHSVCDLMIAPEHGEISLRHLAVLVRATAGDEVRTRVIDLFTPIGFVDEGARTLQSVTTDGPLFIRASSLDLVILPTPEIGAIASQARQAYACLPERVFFGEIEGIAEPRPRRLVREVEGRSAGITNVRAGRAPVMASDELLAEGEQTIGWITVRAAGGVARRPVGLQALDRGVMIGRYGRCDFGTGKSEEHGDELSRVHLLLIKDGSDVLAVDTASSNGTRIGGRMRRIAPLQDGDVLELSGALQLVWNT